MFDFWVRTLYYVVRCLLLTFCGACLAFSKFTHTVVLIISLSPTLADEEESDRGVGADSLGVPKERRIDSKDKDQRVRSYSCV